MIHGIVVTTQETIMVLDFQGGELTLELIARIADTLEQHGQLLIKNVSTEPKKDWAETIDILTEEPR